MASLGELRDALFPAARPLAPVPPDALRAGVTWVRVVRARVPALDGLEAGDLVVAPVSALAVVAAAPADTIALLDACRAARAAGLLVAGPAEDAAAERAVEALSRAAGEPVTARALPAYRLERTEAAQLERSLVAYLVNARAELEHQAALLEARLEHHALAGSDLGALVAELAASLGRAVALEGPRGDVLAVHVPVAQRDAAAAVRAYHARPASVSLRVTLPAPARERHAAGGEDHAAAGPDLTSAASSGSVPATLARASGGGSVDLGSGPSGPPAGRIVLLGSRAPSDFERLALDRVSGLFALQLARDDALRRARDAARRGDSLPAAGPPWIVLVARQVPGETEVPLEAREALRRDLRMLAPARQMTLRGDADSLELRIVAACPADDPEGAALAGRIARLVRRAVAVSRPFDDPSGRPAAEADARSTLEAVEALPDGSIRDAGRGATPHETGYVARAALLPAYRLLGGLHNVPDGQRQARALLAPLLRGGPTAVRERLRTLRSVLETAGPVEAAAALGVHRNTIAYRVRRIESLTGLSLDDPAARLPLAMAVRLMQSEQSGE